MCSVIRYIAASLRNPEQFAAVYDRHADALHRFAERRLGMETADDVVSEAMLAAFQSRHRYDTSRPDARPWLYGILTRKISRHRRTERRHYRVLTRAGGADRAGEEPADRVAATVAAQSVRAPLAIALAGLASRDRDVVLLAAWADLSYQEIADALGIAVGTVRSRLHRARRQLRAALSDVAYPMDTEEAS